MMRVATAAGSRVASGALVAACLLALLGWLWPLATTADGHDWAWCELTIVATISGVVALGALRSARVAMTAPQIMLLLGAAGMVAGLNYDEHSGGFTALVSLCQAGRADFFDTVRLHWQLLPAMHLGMIAGGLATVPLLRSLRRGCRRQFCARLVQNLACSVWMVAGMSAGVLGFLQLAAWAGGRSPMAMLGGMFAGMVWGMVASVAVYRLWFALIAPRLHYKAA